MRLIDVSNWAEDRSNSPYPEGARDKVAYISPENLNDKEVLSNHRFLLKFSNDRYPSQFWAEVVAAKVAELMGVPCPPTFLALHPESGRPGSLVSWFYGESLEANDLPPTPKLNELVASDSLPTPKAPTESSLYVSGGSYMTRMIEGYDLKKGTQHNLRSLAVLLTHFRRTFGLDFWPHWAGVLAFDALIGNTDRHQDNWGVLWRTWESRYTVPRFSPAFDNGTSLMHEIHDAKIKNFQDKAQLAAYIARGTHHLRFKIDDPKRAGHIELLKTLVETRPYLKVFVESVFDINLEPLRGKLEILKAMDIPTPLSDERADLMFRSLEVRLENIRTELAI